MPRSRRDLSEPSLVDAWVSGHRKVGRFLDRIEKAFDGSSAFEALLSPIHGLGDGSAGLSGRVPWRGVAEAEQAAREARFS